MSEERFIFATNEKWFLFDNETEEYMDMEDCKDKLNEQQDQISYWKHKVSSLLWILGQFDKAKVKELLKELENEQLRKELDSFKPVVFQDMRKGTVILYSRGDISE